MMAAIRFGTVPTTWSNDDLPDLTDTSVSFERLLDEIALAGFEGTELGAQFPEAHSVLKAALDARGLTLASAPYRPGLTDPAQVEAAFGVVNGYLDRLAAAGCKTLVVSEPVDPARAKIPGRVGTGAAAGLQDDQWQTLADALNELGLRCKERGLQLAFQHHAGTYVATALELKRLMNLTDPTLVGLALDTGHYAFGGGNPADAVETYMFRLRHLRLTDLDAGVKAAVISQGLSYPEAVRKGVFSALGAGCVDIEAIASRLQDARWTGWVVAGQEVASAAPLASARDDRQALDALFGAPVAASPEAKG